MYYSKSTKINKFALLLTTVLFSFFYIFDDDYRISYILLGITVVILFADIIKDKGSYIFHIHKYHCFILSFAIFSLASAMWAWNASYAIEKSVTIIELLVCMSVLYSHFYNYYDIDHLLKVIMYAGIIVTFYSFSFYGVGEILGAITNSLRLWNSFANINAIAMIAATSMIICMYYVLFKKQMSLIIYIIPLTILISASGSRKALVMVLLGMIIMGMKRVYGKNMVINVFKISLFLMLVIIFFKYLSTLPLFSGITERMRGLIALITGNGKVDSSALVRQMYIQGGVEQFLKTPIAGIGIGNGRLVVMSSFGVNEYLHNNYIELLCGVGSIGFGIYYSMYAYILCKLIKNWNDFGQESIVIFTLILFQLITDYGSVSYYSKQTYFYLMVFFIYVRKGCKTRRDI